MAKAIKIPLKRSNEVVNIFLDNLPNWNKVLSILKTEHSDLYLWIELSLEYYKKGNSDALVKILESSLINANTDYKDSDKDRLKALDTLAAYYVQTANREKTKDKRQQFFDKASQLYVKADKIMKYRYNTNHLLGRAFFSLSKGDQIDQAEKQLDFVLSKSLNNIQALLGKACIAFKRNDYTGALEYYRKVLRSNPNCPADVRLGMAHCFWNLGNLEKAQAAFERTLELDSECVGATVGLAILKLNSSRTEDIKLGVNMLSKAYATDETYPVLLNHFSNHFFFKKNYNTAKVLALLALENTDDNAVKAESYFHIARIYHSRDEYEQAFQYYYQAYQFAPTTFIFPLYGLGQMYLKSGNVKNAVQCFEKVLESDPENYESMQVLGSLYASSNNQQKRDTAKNYFKKVTKYSPRNINAWIGLAQTLEQTDLEESLSAYNTAMELMHKSDEYEFISPEIPNNMAALNYRIGNIDKSQRILEESVSMLKNMTKMYPKRYSSIIVTTTYNLGRIYDVQRQFQIAETIYKNILKEHPNYIDCYLRLGCMARDRNNICEASDWFKEALNIDCKNANAWALLGNLHMEKFEWGPAQKKYERMLKNPSTVNDTYALIAMGNIWLQTYNRPFKNKDQEKRHGDLALKCFIKVMKIDPKNIWAANGIGCVMAYRNNINEAKYIFDEVREATADFCDVWLNIAHIYLKQKDYIKAIQMYESCRKKFFKHDDVKILEYLGLAYFKGGFLKESKSTFSKARFVAPHDNIIIHNIAIVLQKLSAQILNDNKSSLEVVLKAVKELKLSRNFFQHLSNHGDRKKYDVSLAGIQVKQCETLLFKAPHIVSQVQKREKEEREMRLKQEAAREAFRIKCIKEQTDKMIEQENIKKEKLLKRLEYKERTKNAVIFKGHVKRKRRTKLFANNGCKQDGPNEALLSSKHKLKILSKAIISTSEDDSNDDEKKKQATGQIESRSRPKSSETSRSHSTSSRSGSRSSSRSRSSSGSRSSSRSRSRSGSRLNSGEITSTTNFLE